MKQIIIALVAAVILASASNSQAVGPNNSAGSRRARGRQNRISRNGGTFTQTGSNGPRNILVKAPAAGPTAGSPGAQAASNPLILDKKKKTASQ